ncbi:50S ribosomal protein L25 [Brassicibacter mesophilus]|uniref:50S ribosomal protein L25 n=1 Tax=Brassicibacter mesophilus TaxID=745119 RepID=UPI003D22B068
MAVPKLKAEIRNSAGSRNSIKLRNEGFIPGVLYGHNKETKPIKVNKNELQKVLIKYGSTGTINVELEDNTVPVLIKEIQRHVIKDSVLHLDLQQLSEDKKVKLRVPIVIQGREKVERSTGIVEQQLMEMEIQCLPKYITQAVTVDVSKLKFGEIVTINDLDIAKDENYEVLTELSEVIVSMTAASKEEEPVEERTVPIYESTKSILDN